MLFELQKSLLKIFIFFVLETYFFGAWIDGYSLFYLQSCTCFEVTVYQVPIILKFIKPAIWSIRHLAAKITCNVVPTCSEIDDGDGLPVQQVSEVLAVLVARAHAFVEAHAEDVRVNSLCAHLQRSQAILFFISNCNLKVPICWQNIKVAKN